MLRSLLLLIIICNVIVLSSGCSFTNQGIDRNTNTISQVNSNVVSVTNEYNSDKYMTGKEFGDDMKDYTDEISKKLRLPPLMKNKQSIGLKLRLWINSGMHGDEKLLIVQSTEGGSQAFFYHFLKTPPDPIKFDKEVLISPKSGWDVLLSEVSSRLATPDRLATDPDLHISRHEGLISIEFVEKGEYQFALYGHHTKFADGIRLINLCEYLSGEFGVNIDCRGERTALGSIVGSVK